MNFRFRTIFTRLCPTWLWGGVRSEVGSGGRVLYSLGRVLDANAEAWRQALLARMPQFALPGALPLLGRDRGIIRGRDESNTSYASRLISHWDDNHERGMPFAMLRQIRAYLQGNHCVRIVTNSGQFYSIEENGTYVTSRGRWQFGKNTDFRLFYVIIFNAFRFGFDAGKTCTATYVDIATIKQIIRDWSPVVATCEYVILANCRPSELFLADSAGNPVAGEWEHWAFGDPYRPVRNKQCRFWRL